MNNREIKVAQLGYVIAMFHNNCGCYFLYLVLLLIVYGTTFALFSYNDIQHPFFCCKLLTRNDLRVFLSCIFFFASHHSLPLSSSLSDLFPFSVLSFFISCYIPPCTFTICLWTFRFYYIICLPILFVILISFNILFLFGCQQKTELYKVR